MNFPCFCVDFGCLGAGKAFGRAGRYHKDLTRFSKYGLQLPGGYAILIVRLNAPRFTHVPAGGITRRQRLAEIRKEPDHYEGNRNSETEGKLCNRGGMPERRAGVHRRGVVCQSGRSACYGGKNRNVRMRTFRHHLSARSTSALLHRASHTFHLPC